MLTAQDRQMVNRTGSPLNDGPVWAQIRRAAQDLAERPLERPVPQAVEQLASITVDGMVARCFTIDGEWYDVRSGTVVGPGVPVMVVLLERCDGKLPTDEQMPRDFGFTASETRVARLLASRLSNREIAWELDVTEHTARRHTEKVLQKLGVRRRTEVERALATTAMRSLSK